MKELQDKAVQGARGNLAVLSCSSGVCVGRVPQPENIPQEHLAPRSTRHCKAPRSSLRDAPCPAASAAASLRLQQRATHVGSCVVSLAYKLYGNLSSLLALSLEARRSRFR